MVHTTQFAHDNPKLRRNRRVGGNFFAQHVTCRKCAAVWRVVLYSKHGKKVKKLHLFQTSASLVNTTLSGRTCAVWIIRKTLHVLPPGSLDDGSGPGTRTACQQTVAQSHSSTVTSVKNSAYVVYWVREQSNMSCWETEEHNFDEVIQNHAHIAWQAISMVEQATESPAYLPVIFSQSCLPRKDRNKHWCLQSQGTAT